jgi:hypothetical protein
MTARDQSILSAAFSSARRISWSCCQTPGGLPVAKPSPAGHAAAAAHLQRQVLPRDAGLEDEEDAGQRLAIVEGLATGESEPPWLEWRQQRLDPFPEFIGW